VILDRSLEYVVYLPYSQGLMVAANYTDDGGYKRSSGFDQTKLSVRHTYDGEGFSTDTIFSGADLDQDTAISPSLSSASTSRKISHCRLNKNDDGSTRRLWSRYIDQRSRTRNSAKFLQEYTFDLVCVPVFEKCVCRILSLWQ
jgi:hypothetical protein